MAWKGVITNRGSELLAQWTTGKTLTITRAAAGTGRVSETAMLAQAALVDEKQAASILSNKATAQGQKLQLQVTPQTLGYALNQLGVWAKLGEGEEKMIALFQTDTAAGVEIPSKESVPDYVYTFYGLLEFSGTGGTLQVTIDASALATLERVEAAIQMHNVSENAHQDIRRAIQTVNQQQNELASRMVGLNSFDLTITVDAWIKDKATTDKYAYYADVENEYVSLSHLPDVTLDKKSLGAACACGMAHTVDTPEEGKVRFYAQELPTADISGTCKLWTKGKSGGTSGGGGESYELPIASATTLGGVKIGEGIDVSADGTISSDGKVSPDQIAQTSDVQEMLTEVFGNQENT